MRRNPARTRPVKVFRSAALLLAALCAGACAPSLPPPPLSGKVAAGDHIRARMISESVGGVPGSTLRIAVLFELDPNWHLYAPYRNDTGLPVLLEPTGPEGVRFGPIGWPAPQRLVSEGAILDHVYGGRVAAVIPVDIPAGARPGTPIRIECRLEWLVCGRGCIPGDGLVDLEIPIVRPGVSPPPSADAGVINETLDRLPRPAREMAGASTETWGSADWSIRVPGARALAFFPGDGCVPLENPIAEAESNSDRLHLRLAPGSKATGRMTGTLEVTTLDGTDHYAIDSISPLQ